MNSESGGADAIDPAITKGSAAQAALSAGITLDMDKTKGKQLVHYSHRMAHKCSTIDSPWFTKQWCYVG